MERGGGGEGRRGDQENEMWEGAEKEGRKGEGRKEEGRLAGTGLGRREGGDADNKKNGWRKEKELKERVVGKVLVHWWGKQ